MALSRPKITTPGSPSGGSSQGITCNAGSDVQSSSSANKTLSGSVSNGSATSWAWTLLSKPSSSSASITSASSQSATLTGIDKRGAYVCKLVVQDSDGFTDADRVVIDYAPGAVVSNAGSDVQTASSSNQTLSGSGSGGTGSLSYAWVLVSRPAGSSASITSATSATATLTGIDAGGAYVCALTVTDSAATPISTVDTVVIDYSAGAAAAWYDVLDLDFTSATAGALTANSTTTVDGRDWWFYTPSSGSTSAVITSNGLEVDFASTVGNILRVTTSVNSLITKTAAGTMPRIKVTVVFSGLVTASAGSYFGACVTSYTRNNSTPGLPMLLSRYYRTGAGPTYKYSAYSRKGSAIGSGAASGSLSSADVASDGNSDSGCIELMMIGGGWYSAHGHDGDTTPASGSDTFRAWAAVSQSTSKSTTLSNIWELNSGDGPWCGMHFRAGGNTGEAVVIERLIVQEWR